MSFYFDEEEAIDKLRTLGYRVHKEDHSRVGNITNTRQVVDWFYSRRLFYNANRKFPMSMNYSADTKSLSVFIRQRQKIGLGRKEALREAALLIDDMFKYEKHLGLKEPITSIGILTQSSIMNRVCAYANGEVPLVEEEKDHVVIDKINKIYNRDNADEDKQLASQRMDKMLEKLYGKK
jgi:hypothetical protein